MFDLTKYCALCGGVIANDPENVPGYVAARVHEPDPLHKYPCSCESRALKGHCGDCRACRIAQHGCACDGAFDAGCFNCTPKEFERPSCPKENFNRCPISPRLAAS